MSTVPKADTPPPANNAKTLTIGDGSGMYARPTAGGNASGDVSVPAGPTPDYSINRPGAAPTDAGPNMGHGATQIMAQPDATGAPESAIGGGTVGTTQGGPHS